MAYLHFYTETLWSTFMKRYGLQINKSTVQTLSMFCSSQHIVVHLNLIKRYKHLLPTQASLVLKIILNWRQFMTVAFYEASRDWWCFNYVSFKCYKIIILEDMCIILSHKICPIMSTLKPHLELSIISWHLSNFITPALLEHSLRQWSPWAKRTHTNKRLSWRFLNERAAFQLESIHNSIDFWFETKAMWEILCWNTQCWFICETRRAQLTIAEIFWPSPSICTHTRTHTPTCASVGNISLHFQTFILPLIVIIQWYFCLLHTEIWSDHHQSVWNDMKKQNKLRPTQSRRTVENNVSKMLQETSLQSSLRNYAQVHRGQKLL